MAESKHNLLHLLQKLNSFTEEKRLEINYEKTKIIKLGPGSGQEYNWTIGDINSNHANIIEEANFYDYLGVLLGKTRTFSQFLKNKKEKLPQKIGFLKAKANNTPDRTWAAHLLWNRMVKPTLLYGAEVITYPKVWLRHMEAAQNKLGRWILGVGYQCSSAGVRGELGWTTLTGEITKQKVSYWIKLSRMDNQRWPKQLFM